MKLLQEVEEALQRSAVGRVLFVEGKDDALVLPALLGVEPGIERVDDVVLVVAHGAERLTRLVEAAAGVGLRGVFGVCDGDGKRAADLEQGPLFVWPAYDIESLLVRAVWPPVLGPEPDWELETRAYTGDVALNRLPIRRELTTFQRFAWARRDRVSGQRELASWWGQVRSGDPLNDYTDLADAYETRTPVDRHQWLSGKRWMQDLGRPLGPNEAAIRDAWARAATEVGGSPEVRAWWDRHVRPPPIHP